MIEQAIIILISVLVGYFLGHRNDPLIEKVKYRARKLGTIITHTASNIPASGIIYRPSAKRLRQIKGDKRPETEAMIETLEQLPEIQEARKALKKL